MTWFPSFLKTEKRKKKKEKEKKKEKIGEGAKKEAIHVSSILKVTLLRIIFLGDLRSTVMEDANDKDGTRVKAMAARMGLIQRM